MINEHEMQIINEAFKSYTDENPLRDDRISRKEAIRRIEEAGYKISNPDTVNGLCGAIGILWDMPSADEEGREDEADN